MKCGICSTFVPSRLVVIGPYILKYVFGIVSSTCIFNEDQRPSEQVEEG